MIRRALLVLLLLAVGVMPSRASAQDARRGVTLPRDTIRAKADTTRLPRRDSLRTRADSLRSKADTLARGDTIGKANFAPPDSVMQRLMSTPGYTTTRYQGETITFDAITRAIQLTNKAIVYSEKDSQLVKSDTIRYAGSGDSVMVPSRVHVFNVLVRLGLDTTRKLWSVKLVRLRRREPSFNRVGPETVPVICGW